MKKIISATLALLFVFTLIASPALAADSPKKMKIAFCTWAGYAPLFIAKENGYFADEGFDVNLISTDFEARKIGLNNGSIPIVNGDFQFFPSIDN